MTSPFSVKPTQTTRWPSGPSRGGAPFNTVLATDTATGIVKTYTNPLGRLASVADVDAF